MAKSENSNKITKGLRSWVVGSKPGDNHSELEGDWLDLVREAMKSGITKKQFQDFLQSEAQKSGIVIHF